MIPEVRQDSEFEIIREGVGRFLSLARIGEVKSYCLLGGVEDEEGLVPTDYLAIFPTGRRSVNIVPISDAEIPPHKLTFLHLISTLAVPSSIARSERPDERLYQTNLDRAIKERLPIAVLVFYNLGEESLGGDERAVLKAVKGLSPTSITEWFREFAKISLEELTRWN